MDSTLVGKTLIVVGLVVAALGLIILLGRNVPLLGRLPGDIVWQTGGVKIFFPLATMILISIVLTVLLNLFLAKK